MPFTPSHVAAVLPLVGRAPLVPASLRSRLGAVATAALVVVSLVVGGATHVLWDAFTHEGRAGVAAIPWLAEQHGRLPGYRWLQYGSSLLGLAAIAGYLVCWWRRETPGQATPSAMVAVSRGGRPAR